MSAFKSYKEWEDSDPVSEVTYEFGRDGIRDIYTLPCGVKIFDEVFMPRSIFQPQTQRTLVDYLFPESKKEWVESKGATFCTDYCYSPEGYGSAIFVGKDSTEKAYNFAHQFCQEC